MLIDKIIILSRIIFITFFIILSFQIISPYFITTKPMFIASASNISIVNPNLKVYVKGAVKKKGLYYLPEGSRVMDAITKAGGVVKEADLTSLNLAGIVKDGDSVYVPTKQETAIANKSPATIHKKEKKKSNKIEPGDPRIKLNKAGIAELMRLPYIGEKTAKAIIQYRTKNNGFKNIEELKNVPRIGEKRFNKIKDFVTLE